MFVDRTRIKVTGGAGGNGCCSFRREKYVPLGGPNGGDGGAGGSVYFVAANNVTSLEPVRYATHRKAASGVHGKGSDCHGRCGEDCLVEVPLGTLVRDAVSEEILADLTEEGLRFLAARGGIGGKGNARFASSTQRAPHFAQRGEPGQDAEYVLELKLIADVGIVGLPNAGKSTLLSRISGARPKIDSYPFTTLSPNLGVARLDGFRTLTVADIPGIIEGAAEGKGLGHDFLRHIERTRVLLFLIDLGDEDPPETLRVLEHELEKHSPVFAARPRMIVLNKADVSENQARVSELTSAFSEPFVISAVTGKGVPAVIEHLWRLSEAARAEEASALLVLKEPEREYAYEAPFSITKKRSGFCVEGAVVLRTVQMTDLDNDFAVRHLQEQLRKFGLFRALKRYGAQQGDTVSIGDFSFEYHSDE